MSWRRILARELAKGAAAGAAAFAAVDGAFMTIAWLTTADSATPEAARALERLGDQRLQFALAVLGGVAVMGALVGAGQTLFRWIAAARPCSVARHLLWSALLGLLWTVRQLLARPALFGAALPEVEPLTTLAVHCGPRLVDALFAVAIAACLVRWVRRRRAAARARAAAAAAAILVLAALLLGSATDRAPAGVPAPLNVLVLAVDSVRPDHLSLLGYPRPTTPNIDALARSGILFDRALSPIARTTPAWISMLSGQYPHTHGVRHMFPSRSVRVASLPSLARVAAERGYRTAVVADYAGDFFPKFKLGFSEQVTPPPLNTRTVFQRELVQRLPLALAFLNALPEPLRPAIMRYLLTNADPALLSDEIIQRLDGSRPFFVVGFFSATHAPFASSFPHHTRFTSPRYRGPHRFQYGLTEIKNLKHADERPAAPDIDQIIGLYDGALAATDQAIGKVLLALERRGLRERTLVVFLSDHGENLFEPGLTTLHGDSFRGGDEANCVPWILAGPGLSAGRRIGEPVSLVDVAPTIAGWLGWGMPGPVDGRSLVGTLRGAAAPDRPVFAETDLPLSAKNSPLPPLLEMLTADPDDDEQVILDPRFEDLAVAAKHRALWYGRHKLIYQPRPGGVRLQLFDLGADPHQQRPLPLNDELGRRLQRWLFDWLRADPLRELDLQGRVRVWRVG